MAEVFKAHPAKAPGKLLAIKRILPQFSQNRELVSMLIKEASVSVSLQHPNIVTTFDFGMIAGTYFLAMEFVHGKDLKSIMLRVREKRGEIPIHLALHIVVQTLRGLDYAHHKLDNYQRPLEIVHRDISPQNIMISYHGQTKILDFGIAKVTAKQDPAELGVLKGKFSYMSPEQAYGKSLDPRSDIYSSAIVLWELLTMQSCYDGKTDLELLRIVREAKPRLPETVNPKVPKELSGIIMKALSKKVSQRYDTAGDFADALEKFQRERFGTISQDDVSAFLRSYFKFDLAEMKETISILEFTNPEIEAQKKEAYLAIRSNPQIRAPWVHRERQKLTSWIYPFTICLGIALAMWLIKPRKIFLWYDNLSMKGVEFIQAKMGFIPSEKKSRTISLRNIPLRQSKYRIMYSNKAKETMDDLPFETFDHIREAIDDLSVLSDPNHRLVSSKQENPYLLVQNYKVVVIPNSMTQTLLVNQVVPATFTSSAPIVKKSKKRK